jgi:toxin CcdB
MKQFDVVANPFPRTRERHPYLVTLQSDLLLRSLDTVVVAPLESAKSGLFADRLNPRVDLDNERYAIIVQELVAVRKSVLGHACGSIAADRDAIIAALDLVFTGF